MSDDIETLRRLADGLGTEERKEAMAALESVEKELMASVESVRGLGRLWHNAETDRNSLRAKLDRAKEAVSLLLACPEIADADPSDKDEETHTAERNARAVLSADAPVQQTLYDKSD